MYSDFDGVVKRANNTEFGLASGVFTKDISKAMNFAEKIDAGTVFINTYNKTDVAAPFGGFKQSGFGKDLGNTFLIFILNIKAVTRGLLRYTTEVSILDNNRCVR